MSLTPEEIAQQRIDECRRTRSVELDLSGLGLEEIPEEVFELVWLEKLYIYEEIITNGKIKKIPRAINRLTKLNTIDITGQKLKELNWLAHTPKLRKLLCGSNLITNISGLKNTPQLNTLYISDNKIKSLEKLKYVQFLKELYCEANEIDELSFVNYIPLIETLHFDENKIKEPPDLFKALNLKDISFEGANISSLDFLEKNTNLIYLNCNTNTITSLSPLVNLLKLQVIQCNSNKIQEISPLSELKNLRKFWCMRNIISDLSPLKNLNKLTEIVCAFNNISTLDTIYNLVMLGSLEDLSVYGNPIVGMPKPFISVLGGGHSLKNIQNYWKDIGKGSVEQQQLKVQFIGNGRVGKTTLAYALEHKRAPAQPCKSTHGITIKEIRQVIESEDEPFTLQLRDFGGQEIYHATHRLFLSDDSLYLLLWAEDQQEKEADETNHSPAYWLELIHDLAPHSPVILVKNQIDRSDKLPIRPAELTEDIPGVRQIRQEVKISAQQYRNMSALRGAIESVLEELKHRVCLELPVSWLQVQDELKQLERETIPFAHFKQICIKAGVSHAEWFAGYLHKTGVVFYREGAFQDQVILDQNWAINAAYRVFDPNKPHRSLLERMGGRFTGEDARLFWNDEATENTERGIYLDFMRNCGICYEPDQRKIWQEQKPLAEREFIVPALLPLTSPAQFAWGEARPDDWQLDIAYPFLHRSIIERIILRLGETYAGEPWRSGIFCTTDTGQLLLECEYSNKQESTQGHLHFRLRSQQPEQLVYALRKLISEVSPHRRYTEYLQQADAERIKLPEFKDEDMAQKSRLDDTQPTGKTVKLFISYSHADEAHKDQLEKHLKAISRNLPLSYWSDRTLFAGEPVDEQIFQQLNTADIIVLLISPDFINSDYCFTQEMERALERYKNEGNVVIPIIIRHTASWRNHEIGKIVALPKDGKPLKKWDDEDEFWGSVEEGTRAQVEKLIHD